MTKKILDAKALKTLIKSINLKSAEAFDEDENRYDKFVPTKWLVETINQLATPAPATDVNDKNVSDIKFDIDKWKKYLNTNGYEGVLYKILFSNKKTLELIPNVSGGEFLDAFGDDNFNPLINDFHKNIFICLGLDIKDFLCEKQESIYDAEG